MLKGKNFSFLLGSLFILTLHISCKDHDNEIDPEPDPFADIPLYQSHTERNYNLGI